jgi:hypothetical protein
MSDLSPQGAEADIDQVAVTDREKPLTMMVAKLIIELAK